MRILFLTQIVPYPPDAGPKVKTWHVLRYLAGQGHQLTLATFVRPEEQQYIPFLKQVCQSVYTIPIRRSRLADLAYLLRSQLSGRPFLVERDDLSAMRACVQSLVAAGAIDAIHADQLTMTQFALGNGFGKRITHTGTGSPGGGGSPWRIFDAHNAVWTIVDRMRAALPWYARLLLRGETGRVKRFEGLVVERFEQTLAVTEIDRQMLLDARQAYLAAQGDHSIDPQKITVAPIAVDTQELQPVPRQADSSEVLTLGTLHYPPNADGIRWFANEVFPLVRARVAQAHLTIVGKNPPPDFRQLAEQMPDVIRVTGYVADLAPYLSRAGLMVVPVRAGSGMRVRILEAFARGVPVVTTTIGLEGIDARPGQDVLVADTPAEFADAVCRLLNDPQLQAQLAANGRRLAEERYDWKVVLKTVGELYEKLAQEHIH